MKKQIRFLPIIALLSINPYVCYASNHDFFSFLAGGAAVFAAYHIGNEQKEIEKEYNKLSLEERKALQNAKVGENIPNSFFVSTIKTGDRGYRRSSIDEIIDICANFKSNSPYPIAFQIEYKDPISGKEFWRDATAAELIILRQRVVDRLHKRPYSDQVE